MIKNNIEWEIYQLFKKEKRPLLQYHIQLFLEKKGYSKTRTYTALQYLIHSMVRVGSDHKPQESLEPLLIIRDRINFETKSGKLYELNPEWDKISEEEAKEELYIEPLTPP